MAKSEVRWAVVVRRSGEEEDRLGLGETFAALKRIREG